MPRPKSADLAGNRMASAGSASANLCCDAPSLPDVVGASSPTWRPEVTTEKVVKQIAKKILLFGNPPDDPAVRRKVRRSGAHATSGRAPIPHKLNSPCRSVRNAHSFIQIGAKSCIFMAIGNETPAPGSDSHDWRIKIGGFDAQARRVGAGSSPNSSTCSGKVVKRIVPEEELPREPPDETSFDNHLDDIRHPILRKHPHVPPRRIEP